MSPNILPFWQPWAFAIVGMPGVRGLHHLELALRAHADEIRRTRDRLLSRARRTAAPLPGREQPRRSIGTRGWARRAMARVTSALRAGKAAAGKHGPASLGAGGGGRRALKAPLR